MKLAAYYTIQKELYGKHEPQEEPQHYSRSEQPTNQPAEQPEEYIDYYSGSEFSQKINGMISTKAWEIMDELMDILQATNQRLYAGVIQKLEDA